MKELLVEDIIRFGTMNSFLTYTKRVFVGNKRTMTKIKSNNIKCKSICTSYKWLCDNCIKNLNNYGKD